VSCVAALKTRGSAPLPIQRITVDTRKQQQHYILLRTLTQHASTCCDQGRERFEPQRCGSCRCLQHNYYEGDGGGGGGVTAAKTAATTEAAAALRVDGAAHRPFGGVSGCGRCAHGAPRLRPAPGRGARPLQAHHWSSRRRHHHEHHSDYGFSSSTSGRGKSGRGIQNKNHRFFWLWLGLPRMDYILGF
jgi:hypothetical protein